MAFPRLLRCLTLVSGLAVAGSAGAQFNPEGRSKKPQPALPKGPPRSGTNTGAESHPTSPRGEQGATGEALIARYLRLALEQPGSDFPVERLVQLYRLRDGKLDTLLRELEQRAATVGPTHLAAELALASVHRLAGDPEQARSRYESVLREQPQNPVALTALARLLSERGDKNGAEQRFEQALRVLKDASEREQVRRTLVTLTLDRNDLERARVHHRELVREAKGSFSVRAELGRELLHRGALAEAEEELRGVVGEARGDTRALGPALRDHGIALARLGQKSQAMNALRQSLKVAAKGSGLYREVLEQLAELHRADDRLGEFVSELERSPAPHPDILRLLGKLYEETGQIEKALSIYGKTLAREPRDVATRLRVVSLLEASGKLDQASVEYENLARFAPHNPDYVFRLVELLLQRGDRPRALDRLKALEVHSLQEEETLSVLVDFYERIGEKERALSLLRRLTSAQVKDPEHLVELGARYWEQGDAGRAVATWQRILQVVPERATALLRLGEIYLEHDMPKEALAALGEAMRLSPSQARFSRAYALALERVGATSPSGDGRQFEYDEARKIWERLLHEAGHDPHLSREARQHIVSLWNLSGQLPARTPPLEQKLAQNPADLSAGRLLAEAYLRQRRYGDAERVLRRVIQSAPGEPDALSQLEQVLVIERKQREAIEVLKKLVKVDPKRSREYYQRMAGYAAELYEDEEAIEYAARAVELNPEDAEGHRKLGTMYRQRQEMDRAATEFRRAIAKNDRLFPVYLELAELLTGQNQLDEADALLRRVVRASPDDELVARAARLCIQLNLGRGSLDSLERELLPLTLNNPQRPLYRQLLIEVYGALTYPLIDRQRSPDPAVSEAARQALRRIGERAVKPLLDALGDTRPSEQKLALSLLGQVQNTASGPALLAYATGSADPELRAQAMLAAGQIRDPALLARYAAVLAPEGRPSAEEADPVVLAAAWGVARLRAPQARALLFRLARSEAPSLRALALLGLALLRDASALPEVERAARSLEAGPLPRAAAAYALGALGAKGQAPVLAELLTSQDFALRSTALLAIARLGVGSAPAAIAETLFSPEPRLQQTAALAAMVWATRSYREPEDVLAPPDGRISARDLIEKLRPDGYNEKERAQALEQLAAPLTAAAAASVAGSPERARVIAELLSARSGQVPFHVFWVGTPGNDSLIRAKRVAEEVGKEVIGAYATLMSHPSPEVRVSTIHFLAGRPGARSEKAIVDALLDPAPSVRRAAIAAVGESEASQAVALIPLLSREPDWAIRVSAVEMLGRVNAGSRDPQSLRALVRLARTDAYSLVRQAAVQAAVRIDPLGAAPLLRAVQRSDPEPRVRATAEALLVR